MAVMVSAESLLLFHMILMTVTVPSSRSLLNKPHEKPRPPKVTHISSNGTFTVRANLSFCCIVSGFPVPSVTWRSKDGITLAQKDWTLKDDSLVLSVAKIDTSAVDWTAGGKGEVSCIANNIMGSAKGVVSLTLPTERAHASELRSQPVSNNTCEHLIRVVYGTGVISLAVGAIFTIVFMKLMDIYAKRKLNAERLPLNGFRSK